MLDVFENEPFVIQNPIAPLIDENKLFLSPHIAGWTFESRKRMAEMVISKFNELKLF